MSLLFYRRPDHIRRPHGPIDLVEYERTLEKKSKGIPKELSFDMVVGNRAMPPVSIYSPLPPASDPANDIALTTSASAL